MPKFAAGNREQGTTDENKVIIAASVSHFGTYTVDEQDSSFTFHVEASTYPNWDGSSQKRHFTVSGDELKYTVLAASGVGSSDIVWKCIK